MPLWLPLALTQDTPEGVPPPGGKCCISAVVSYRRSDDPLLPQSYAIVQKSFQGFESIFPASTAFVALDDLIGIRAFEPGMTQRIPVCPAPCRRQTRRV